LLILDDLWLLITSSIRYLWLYISIILRIKWDLSKLLLVSLSIWLLLELRYLLSHHLWLLLLEGLRIEGLWMLITLLSLKIWLNNVSALNLGGWLSSYSILFFDGFEFSTWSRQLGGWSRSWWLVWGRYNWLIDVCGLGETLYDGDSRLLSGILCLWIHISIWVPAICLLNKWLGLLLLHLRLWFWWKSWFEFCRMKIQSLWSGLSSLLVLTRYAFCIDCWRGSLNSEGDLLVTMRRELVLIRIKEGLLSRFRL